MPLRFVKNPRPKDLIFSPSIQKLLANEVASILTTPFVKGEVMASVSHAC